MSSLGPIKVNGIWVMPNEPLSTGWKETDEAGQRVPDDVIRGLQSDTNRLDWWFDCNEKERGHVMALVHMKGLSKRDAIDQVMNTTKGAKR